MGSMEVGVILVSCDVGPDASAMDAFIDLGVGMVSHMNF